MADLLRYITTCSMVKPLAASDVSQLFTILPILLRDDNWKTNADISKSLVTSANILSSFKITEDMLEQHEMSATARYKASAFFRRWASAYAVANALPESERVKYRFKTRFSFETKPRSMISDLSAGDYPLGAMIHENPADLDKKIRSRIDATLSLLLKACLTELDTVREDEKKLFELIEGDIPKGFFLALRQALNAKYDNFSRNDSWIWNAEPELLIRCYYSMMTVHQKKFGDERDWPEAQWHGIRPKTKEVFSTPRMRELTLFLGARFDPRTAATRSGNITTKLFGIACGAFDALVSCALIIQIYTGWNISSVISINEDDIKLDDGGGFIQGFKSKTGDYTPYFYITAKDAELIVALKFLLKRLGRMKVLQWVGPHEKGLWLGIRSINSPPKAVCAWSFGLREFRKKHGLPHFTFEQIRVEVLARIAVGKGGLEAARLVGGHSDISTTGKYVDQLLMQRRNSSISLRFQQSIQASVQYRMRAERLPANLDENLLLPVGDGASCSDPMSPPFLLGSSDQLCDAKRCHVDNGCPNRRIVINEDRIEEIFRYKDYFEENWKEMLERNMDKFVNYDLPAWNFNEGIRAVIARGPYRSYLKKYVLSASDVPEGGDIE